MINSQKKFTQKRTKMTKKELFLALAKPDKNDLKSRTSK